MTLLAPDPRPTPARAGAYPPAIGGGPGAVVAAAPAKINLFLEIHGKRADGYHDLASLMLAVDLFDTLEIRATVGNELRVRCDTPGVPSGPGNLVHKAADALRRRAGRPDLGADIRLTKRIPHQAGLGGGSGDAAAALTGLNAAWNLGLARVDLAAVAAEVGSDVAFFLNLPAGWCTGRGEVVEPETVGGTFWFVVARPPVGLATADVYRRLTVPASPRGGKAVRAAVRAGDPEALGAAAFNRLEEPAFALSPTVQGVYQRLAAQNPAGCRMSGSGSAVFAVCRDRAEAERVAAGYRHAARPPGEPEGSVFVVRSLPPHVLSEGV